MKNTILKNVRAWASEGFTLALSLSMAFQPLTPAFATDTLNVASANVNGNNMATTLPDGANICSRLKKAQLGDFVDENGQQIKINKAECLGMNRGERMRAASSGACTTTVPQLLQEAGITSDEGKQAKIDEICSTGTAGSGFGQAGEVYCALRQAAKNGQAIQYCNAYEEANQAKNRTNITLALDASAAGICGAEYFLINSRIAAYKMQKSAGKAPSTPPTVAKICGGAALAGGLAEVAHTAQMLMGHNKSAGATKVDGAGEIKKRDWTGQALETIASSYFSYQALKIGVCSYPSTASGFPQMCGLKEANAVAGKSIGSATYSCSAKGVCEAQANVDSAQTAHNTAVANSGQAPTKIPFTAPAGPQTKEVTETQEKLTAAQAELAGTDPELLPLKEQAMLAKQAAVIFTGLAAMRTLASLSAAKTMKNSEEMLRTMFGNGTTGTAFAGPIGATAGANVFAATGSNGFATISSNNGTQSGATAAPPGSAEAALLPPHTPLGGKAASFASQIPASNIDSAASNGASGLGGLIASTASAAGAKGDLSELHAMTAAAFAAMPSDGYSGGGGKAMASKGDSAGGGFDLKSLFGGADKEGGEQVSAGRSDVAFRSPAAEEDIWHSQNTAGNNLFQIVSEKYDRVQRKSAVGSDL